MKSINRIIFSIFLLIFTVCYPNLAFAYTNLDLVAKTAILIEQKTGKILYDKDSHQRMYPASTTKMLTALVAIDYLNPNDLVIVGPEVGDVPEDATKAYHEAGETIKVENLLRGLIMCSGADSACVLAKETVKKKLNASDINYDEAKKAFCALMNEKAKSLGAYESNFTNPDGYHSDDHYSTAYDIAMISRAVMENDLLRKIANEKSFEGNGAGNNEDPSLLTQDYIWKTHNELLNPDSDYYYSYANGIKTGFTDEAGDCISASAEKDNKQLIAVVMYSPMPGRWTDSVKLLEYGFETFHDEFVQKSGTVLDKVSIANSKLGDDNELQIIADNDVQMYLSKEELSNIKKQITLNPQFVDTAKEGNNVGERFIAPIKSGDVIATVQYSLDDKVLYTENVITTKNVECRTLKTDVVYYFQEFKTIAFSVKAIPYWGLVLVILLLLIGIIIKFTNRKKS